MWVVKREARNARCAECSLYYQACSVQCEMCSVRSAVGGMACCWKREAYRVHHAALVPNDDICIPNLLAKHAVKGTIRAIGTINWNVQRRVRGAATMQHRRSHGARRNDNGCAPSHEHCSTESVRPETFATTSSG